MKKYLKQLIVVIVSLFYLLKWAILFVIRHNYSHGGISAQKKKGVRILGNGPSLKKLLEIELDCTSFDYCCVNYSPLSEDFFRMRPKYYITLDPAFFTEILLNNTLIVERINMIDWEIIWFVPCGEPNFVRKLFPHKTNFTFVEHPGGLYLEMRIPAIRNFLFRNGFASPPAQNVIGGALYDLIKQGYNNIELYGVEHSWLQNIAVNNNNEVCLVDSHYYDTENPQLVPWYTCTGEVHKMHVLLSELAVTFESYHDIRRFADSIGDIKILNCTPHSYIDAFERKI